MLARMTPQQWHEWKAKQLIEPIGTDLHVCEILTKIAIMLAGMLGIKADETAFMPWKQKPEKQVDTLTPKQSRAALTQHLKTVAQDGKHR